MTQIKEKVILLGYFIFAALDALIALRVLCVFLGANTQSGFVTWLYQTTQPLVEPFLSIFSTPSTSSYTIEIGSVLAILFYAITGYVLGEFISAISKRV